MIIIFIIITVFKIKQQMMIFSVSKNPPHWPTNNFFFETVPYIPNVNLFCLEKHTSIHESDVCYKNFSHNVIYCFASFNFLFHDFFYYDIKFQFALRRCLELSLKPTFCSNWLILCYHLLRLETCLMERV